MPAIWKPLNQDMLIWKPLHQDMFQIEHDPDQTPSDLDIPAQSHPDVDHDPGKAHVLDRGLIQIEAWIIQKQAFI